MNKRIKAKIGKRITENGYTVAEEQEMIKERKIVERDFTLGRIPKFKTVKEQFAHILSGERNEWGY